LKVDFILMYFFHIDLFTSSFLPSKNPSPLIPYSVFAVYRHGG
jgi:hypothetical protein